MTVKMRYSPAMRGIAVAAAAVALTMTATGTASAWHVPWPHHHRTQAAAVQPIGPCKADPDHIGGSTCEIATYALADGVHVFLQNFNGYPVKISSIYQPADSTHTTTGPQTTVTTRVPARGEKEIVLPWVGDATALYVHWVDEFNNHDLGGKIFDKP